MLNSASDSVINGENYTYIAREILLSKERGDLDRENPDLIVVQRKYAVNGRSSLDVWTSTGPTSFASLAMKFPVSDVPISILHSAAFVTGIQLSRERGSQGMIAMLALTLLLRILRAGES
jgi:hypothetical protein